MFNHSRVSYSAYHNMNPVRVIVIPHSLEQGAHKKIFMFKADAVFKKAFF